MNHGQNDYLLNILTEFHDDMVKIVDFLLMADFWKCALFSYQTLDSYENTKEM